MKKNKIHIFNDNIFPRCLFIVVTDSAEYLNDIFEDFERENGIKQDEYDRADAITFRCRHRESGLYGVCVAFVNKKAMNVSNMAHEAVHVSAGIHYELGMSMGFNIGEDETFAYIAGWSADCMNQVRTNKFRD